MSYFSYKPVLTNEYFYGKPLEFTHTPQMLFGDTVVEDVYRVKQEQQTPVRYEGNPVLSPDMPWEDENIYRPSVLFDEKINKYRMWYVTSTHQDKSAPEWLMSKSRGNSSGFICYAESDDGVNWQRYMHKNPFGPWEENNIVYFGNGSGCEIGRVIFNPDKSDLEKRFIMVVNEQATGVRLVYSPDGINWTEFPNNPIISVSMDCSLNFAYDESRNMWQMFVRPAAYAKSEDLPAEKGHYPNMNYRRRVCLMESVDLIHWSSPRIVFRAPENLDRDQADNINFFTVNGYPMAFIHCFNADFMDGCRYQRQLPYVAFGRDPYHLRILPENKPIIDYGKKLTYDDAKIVIDTQPLDLFGDGRDYFYYRGYHHNKKKTTITFNMLSFEKDRYIARAADEYGGWLLTKQFIMNGSKIEFDADIPDDIDDGYIEVEILDAVDGHWRGGRAYKGFSIDNSDKITGNSHHLVASWDGNSDVSSLMGNYCYLRFHIVNAKLYSFTIKE